MLKSVIVVTDKNKYILEFSYFFRSVSFFFLNIVVCFEKRVNGGDHIQKSVWITDI